VPTLYAAMLADPACTPENSSARLRMCVSAGEGLPEHIGLEWKKRFGVDILRRRRLDRNAAHLPRQLSGKNPLRHFRRADPGYQARLIDEQAARLAKARSAN